MEYIIGAVIGVFITYIICRFLPQQKIRQLNAKRIEEEDAKIQQAQQIQYKYQEENSKLYQECLELRASRAELIENLFEAERQAQIASEQFLKSKMELAQEQLDRSLEQAAAEFQQEKEEYTQEYLALLEDFNNQFIKYTQEQNIEKLNIQNEILRQQQVLDDLNKKVICAVDAARREQEKATQLNFYRLNLSDTDISEIAKLRSVEPYLRDKEALNKVIWKVYYEKPYSDLIGRIIGNKIKVGIYKITNIENQMCYVGQSVNIADRWKQHIKRGIGAEVPTRNKLYPAMLSFGVENFTFEIIEECDKNQLDEREKYWQEYFQANTFGYSIK